MDSVAGCIRDPCRSVFERDPFACDAPDRIVSSLSSHVDFSVARNDQPHTPPQGITAHPSKCQPSRARSDTCGGRCTSHAELSSSRTNMVLLDWASVVKGTGDGAGKHPPCLGLWTSLFPVQQDSREIGIERKFVLGILGLDLVYNSIVHATADPDVDVRWVKELGNFRPRPVRVSSHPPVRGSTKVRVTNRKETPLEIYLWPRPRFPINRNSDLHSGHVVRANRDSAQ
jgi:hypothetical protein